MEIGRLAAPALLAGMCLALAATNGASASTSNPPSVIRACYSFERDSGELRFNTPHHQCSPGEGRISWNKVGSPGPKGKKGRQGPTGPRGPKGDPGGTPKASAIFDIGAVLFGIVAGWLTYRTLRRKARATTVSDLAAVISAIGGAAVVGIFNIGDSFGWYAIGLFVGFFGYLLVMFKAEGREKTLEWMGDEIDDERRPIAEDGDREPWGGVTRD